MFLKFKESLKIDMHFISRVAVLLLAISGSLLAATYNFQAPAYTTKTDYSTNTYNCNVSSFNNYAYADRPCLNYALTMYISGSFTTSPALTNNMTNVDIAANGMLTAFSVSDGITTYSSTDSTVGLQNGFTVSTDANGNITKLGFLLNQVDSRTYYNDNSKNLFKAVYLNFTSGASPTYGFSFYNYVCSVVANASATIGNAGHTVCTTYTQDFAIASNATVNGGSVAITAAGVTPTAGNSTVASNPTSVSANGSTTATITVTLKDANGNPVSGKTVTLAKSGGSSVISAASGTSNGSGVVTFTVTDTVAEATTYTATDTTDSVAVTQTAQVTFTAVNAPANTPISTSALLGISGLLAVGGWFVLNQQQQQA